MSYPIHKTLSGSNGRTVRTQTGFWGLDLPSGDLNRKLNRTEDMQNLIWNGDALKVRPGYRSVWDFDGKVNGIYFFGKQPVIHVGTELYAMVCDWEEYEEPRPEQRKKQLLYDKMNDAPSHGIVRNQTVTKRTLISPGIDGWMRETVTGDFLFINDGQNYLVYDGETVQTVADPYWGQNIRSQIANEGLRPVYLAEVPFTAVAKVPTSAAADVDPRGDNMLSQFHCDSFYIDDQAEVTEFVLNCPYDTFSSNLPVEIQVRGEDQAWYTYGINSMINALLEENNQMVRLETPPLIAGMNFLPDEMYHIIFVDKGSYKVANDGMDNVRIIYPVQKNYPNLVTRSTVQGLYGADGGDEVLFLGGSEISPGVDVFSCPNNFFCFYETSTERLGDGKAPITGYCRLNDGRIAVLKDEPNGSSVFFRSHQIVSLGTTQSGEEYLVDAYPSRVGAAVEGCVSSHSLGVVGNEPCFLTETGVYSVRSVSNELTNLNETVRRSISVDPALRKLPVREVASVCWNGYYILAFGNEAYLTDGKKEADGSFRFLRWVFGHKITALGKYNSALYLGDADGVIHYLDDSETDAGLPITAYWTLPLQEEESGRRMILRRLFAAFSEDTDERIKVELIQDRVPTETLEISLQEENAALEQTKDAHWVSLLHRPRLSKAISARLDLTGAGKVLLWGVRLIYEKGGMIP